MKTIFRLFTGLIFLSLSLFAWANTLPYMPTPTPPQLDAKSYLLQDNTTGKILVSENADMRVEPASLTKMMTVYVIDQELAANRLSPDDKVRISENAWRTEGSRMFVKVNSTVPARELLKGIIIQSGNDASVAMAEHIAGSEKAFAEVMNHYAQTLGMKDTHFVNATGLPHPEHYTTAHDMAKLAHAMQQFPDTYKLHKEKTFSYNNIKQNNRNLLLWRDKTVDGIKTGHTDSAGYCLVASAIRDDMRLNAVILGAESDGARTEQAQRLLNYGFRFFQTKPLLPAQKILATTRIYQGQQNEINGGVLEDLYVTLPQGQMNHLNQTLVISDELKAPIRRGDVIGTLKITLQDDVLIEKPLVALETVEKGGLWRRFVDWIKLLFKGWFNTGTGATTQTLPLS